MTPEQKKKAVEVIKNDCNARYYYLMADGSTCALGGLALAEGFSKNDLMKAGQLSFGSITRNPFGIGTFIESKYGLTPFQMHDIQNINDQYGDAETRRIHLLAYLDQICPT